MRDYASLFVWFQPQVLMQGFVKSVCIVDNSELNEIFFLFTQLYINIVSHSRLRIHLTNIALPRDFAYFTVLQDISIGRHIFTTQTQN